MTFIQALALGLLQGVTEFLPVSSSGHLSVARSLLNAPVVPLLFDVLLHIATLLAVVVILRQRIWGLLVGTVAALGRSATDQDQTQLRLMLRVVVATAVTGVIAVVLQKTVLERIAGSPRVVGGLFLVTAAILIAGRFLPAGSRSEVSWLDALIIGAAQGLAVLPGISRAGATITAGSAVGLQRREAGEVAFVVAIPAIMGALVLTLRDADSLGQQVAALPMAVGFVAAMAAGLVSLRLLLRVLHSGRLHLFSFYLIPVGIAVLVL